MDPLTLGNGSERLSWVVRRDGVFSGPPRARCGVQQVEVRRQGGGEFAGSCSGRLRDALKRFPAGRLFSAVLPVCVSDARTRKGSLRPEHPLPSPHHPEPGGRARRTGVRGPHTLGRLVEPKCSSKRSFHADLPSADPLHRVPTDTLLVGRPDWPARAPLQ